MDEAERALRDAYKRSDIAWDEIGKYYEAILTIIGELIKFNGPDAVVEWLAQLPPLGDDFSEYPSQRNVLDNVLATLNRGVPGKRLCKLLCAAVDKKRFEAAVGETS
jgi:hypothetical protein